MKAERDPLPHVTREDDIGAVEHALVISVGVLTKQREAFARDDPGGRHLSLAITHIEDAILRIREVR